jgi:hypothetical protein
MRIDISLSLLHYANSSNLGGFVLKSVMIVSTFLTMHLAQASTEVESRISQLKNQISSLAIQNISNIENRDEVRTQLDLLVLELHVLAGPVTEKTWSDFAPGSWQQIWSDERDNSPIGTPQQDLTQIYQYISVNGWGYNFGERIISPTQSVTFALAVQGSIAGDQQTTEITASFFRPAPLAKNESLAELSHKIKTGAQSGFDPQQAGQFPNGPIGAKGILNLKFLDRDLKIGYAPNVFTGVMELFVLRRSDFVVKE